MKYYFLEYNRIETKNITLSFRYARTEARACFQLWNNPPSHSTWFFMGLIPWKFVQKQPTIHKYTHWLFCLKNFIYYWLNSVILEKLEQ